MTDRHTSHPLRSVPVFHADFGTLKSKSQRLSFVLKHYYIFCDTRIVANTIVLLQIIKKQLGNISDFFGQMEHIQNHESSASTAAVASSTDWKEAQIPLSNIPTYFSLASNYTCRPRV